MQYIPPPGIPFPTDQFKELLDELPIPLLILGDFNCKNTIWGSPILTAQEIDPTYTRGQELLDSIEPHHLNILNTGKPTFFRSHNLYHSHLDLSIGSPEICNNLFWDTEPDPHNSDHYPIIISHSLENIYTQKPVKWNFDKTSQAD